MTFARNLLEQAIAGAVLYGAAWFAGSLPSREWVLGYGLCFGGAVAAYVLIMSRRTNGGTGANDWDIVTRGGLIVIAGGFVAVALYLLWMLWDTVPWPHVSHLYRMGPIFLPGVLIGALVPAIIAIALIRPAAGPSRD